MGGAHLFLRREDIFDHFEDAIEPWQSKHQHHHAANARRFDKLLITVSDVMEVFAVTLCFRMLLAANRHIKLGGGFARQDLAQPLDGGRREGRIDHKVGAGEAKHNARFGVRGEAGINKQFPLVAAMDWQQKRQRSRRGDEFAHQPGGLIAIEKLVRYL